MDRNLPEGSRIIGLDLSKKSFTGCILSGPGFVKKQFFSGKMTQDEQGWELIHSHIHVGDLVLMEAGTSSFSLARYLQQHSTAQEVVVLNPGMLRVIWMSQKKNDKSDAAKIACIARDMSEEAWPRVSVPTQQEQAERSSITSYVFSNKKKLIRTHINYSTMQLWFPNRIRMVRLINIWVSAIEVMHTSDGTSFREDGSSHR
jgi:hypothetical protein